MWDAYTAPGSPFSRKEGHRCSFGASVRLVHSSCAWSTILIYTSAAVEVRVKQVLRALDEVKVPGSNSPLVSPLRVAVIAGKFLGPGHGVLQVLGYSGPLVTGGSIQVSVCLGWRLQNVLVRQKGTLNRSVGCHLGSSLALLHHRIRCSRRWSLALATRGLLD
jgi:hypothetical protein